MSKYEIFENYMRELETNVASLESSGDKEVKPEDIGIKRLYYALEKAVIDGVRLASPILPHPVVIMSTSPGGDKMKPDMAMAFCYISAHSTRYTGESFVFGMKYMPNGYQGRSALLGFLCGSELARSFDPKFDIDKSCKRELSEGKGIRRSYGDAEACSRRGSFVIAKAVEHLSHMSLSFPHTGRRVYEDVVHHAVASTAGHALGTVSLLSLIPSVPEGTQLYPRLRLTGKACKL